MRDQSITMLQGIKRFCLWGTCTVIILAAASLFLRNSALRDAALALSVLGTITVTYFTARVINAEREK